MTTATAPAPVADANDIRNLILVCIQGYKGHDHTDRLYLNAEGAFVLSRDKARRMTEGEAIRELARQPRAFLREYRIEPAGLPDNPVATSRDLVACVRILARSPGLRAIVLERGRQVAEEGYDAAHDAGHAMAELADAAGCYAHHAGLPEAFRQRFPPGAPCDLWPWANEAWKPKSARRDLERAGALVAAALDRLGPAQAGEG